MAKKFICAILTQKILLGYNITYFYIRGNIMTELSFENSLRKGLGRSVMALNNPDNLVRYKEIVLDCCLKSISYYTEIEKSRGNFIYTLVKKFEDDKYFLKPVINAYKKLAVGEGLSDGTKQQMTDFLWCFSNDNNIESYNAIKDKFLEIKYYLCTPYVDKNILRDFEMMCFSFIENDGFGGYMRAIQAVDTICIANASLSHSDFDHILRAGCNTYQHRRILKEVSLYASRKMYMYFYRLFQMRGVTEDKNTTRTSLDLLPDLDEVRQTVALIMQYEQPCDDKRLFAVCKKIISLHEIKHKKRVPKDLLLFVYENSPSSSLRARAVHFMGKKKMITPEIAEECLNDCDDYIRSYVKQYQRHRLK